MGYCWLFYRGADRPAGVVIIEASWLVDARRRAIQEGLEAGVKFVDGHMLNDELSAMVAHGEVGRFLLLDEAQQIIERFERTNRQPSPAPTSGAEGPGEGALVEAMAKLPTA